MNEQTAAAAIGLWILLVLGIMACIGYLAMSAVLWRLGRKFQEEDFLAYCIPVYQGVLMCRCAQVSAWHAAALFIPVVNFGAAIWIYGNIARRLGKNFWRYGLGVMLLVPLLVLAFGKDQPVALDEVKPPDLPDPSDTPGTRRYALSCIQGEMAGSRIEIPPGSLVIGRNPQQAQIVLSHPHVSSCHVRLWTEPQPGGARLWLEDMNSTNGTSFRRAGGHDWTVLKSSGIPLGEGDMIRIADGIADFRVLGDSGRPQ